MGGGVNAAAGLTFGTKVQVLSLYGAAKAHEGTASVLSTLAYIAHYKEYGGLKTSGALGDAVERVPVEVWELVSRALQEAHADLATAAIEELESITDKDQAVKTLFRYDISPFLHSYELSCEWPRDTTHLTESDWTVADDDWGFDEEYMGNGCSLSTWTLLRPYYDIAHVPRFPHEWTTGYYGAHSTHYAAFSHDDLAACQSPAVIARLQRFFAEWPCAFPPDQVDWRPHLILSISCTGWE